MNLSYPIGKFAAPENITEEHLEQWIADIETAPERFQSVAIGLTNEQLDTPYRPDGWTVRQVIHHMPDSHMNSYIRFHWALTEENPTIKAYDEGGWANLSYQSLVPIETSLQLLDLIHTRWVILLRHMNQADFQKTFVHPQSGRTMRLDWVTGLYAWHSKHHLAHIETLKQRMSW